MMKMIFAVFLLFGITTASFAQIAQIATCTTDSAYADGVLDARNKVNARPDYAQACDANQLYHNQLNAAYRSGYQNGAANIGVSQESCMIDASGSKVCGYDCKKDRYEAVKCAQFPTQNCVIDRYTQEVMCGYNCINAKNGAAYCAHFYQDNCIQDAYGIVKCGYNCRLSGGSIQCDQRLPAG
jgi:hypothetical protein